MRAIVMDRWGEAPHVRSLPDPVRRPGCSLVRIHAATVGHLDATIASGNFAVQPDLPYIPGVEGAGSILESDTWSAGEKVMVRGAGVGLVRDGTWCEIAEVPDEALLPAPEGMSPELAACFFVPATTAYVAVHDICRVKDGSRVAVTGAGGAVGSIAVQLALQAGASVVAVTRTPRSWVGPRSDRLTLAQPGDDWVVEDGRGVDLLIETVAGPGFATHVAQVTPGGTCALVGYAASPELSVQVPNLIVADVSIVPVNMLRREERARVIADALAEQLIAGDLVMSTTSYEPSDVVIAQADVARGSLGGRAVLLFGQ
jgi:NADPH2:quinone reductase